MNAFYEGMRQHYPWTTRLIASFQAHTHADQKLGHANVFEEMCASVPPLSPSEVKDALNTVRSMAEHLLLFLDGIDVSREDAEALIMQARVKAGWITEADLAKPAAEAEASEEQTV